MRLAAHGDQRLEPVARFTAPKGRCSRASERPHRDKGRSRTALSAALKSLCGSAPSALAIVIYSATSRCRSRPSYFATNDWGRPNFTASCVCVTPAFFRASTRRPKVLWGGYDENCSNRWLSRRRRLSWRTCSELGPMGSSPAQPSSMNSHPTNWPNDKPSMRVAWRLSPTETLCSLTRTTVSRSGAPDGTQAIKQIRLRERDETEEDPFQMTDEELGDRLKFRFVGRR